MKVLTNKQLQVTQYLVMITGVFIPFVFIIIFPAAQWIVWMQGFILLIGGGYVFWQLKMMGKEAEIRQRLIRTLLLLVLAVSASFLYNKYYVQPKVQEIIKQHQ